MRLFEATGMGTMLITDWKVNLHKMFEPGKEVITYRTAEECADLIHYYLEHDTERETIARAGQERTLREHTYYQRMRELDNFVGKYL
jgi:spore maturation protein CgeB